MSSTSRIPMSPVSRRGFLRAGLATLGTAALPTPFAVRDALAAAAEDERMLKITGHEVKNASEFRKWLIAHAKEFGLDPKELSKKGALKNKKKKK